MRNSISHTLRRALAGVAAAAALAACSGDSLYCRYPCRLVLNTATYLSPSVLATVGTKGVFCKATKGSSATRINFSNSAGLADAVDLAGFDQRATTILGTNGSLIFGYGSLDEPPVLYAYDGECPNCFDPEAVPVVSRRLTLGTDGLATCPTCHRRYNLNTGGGVVDGDRGSRLWRYRASYTPAGVLMIGG